MTNKKFLFLILVFFISKTVAQNLDSLYAVAKTIKDDSTKIRLYNKISFGYIFNDTDKALQVINEGKQLAIKSDFNFGLTELTNTHGIYMDVLGKSDSANYYFKKALNLSRQHHFKNIEVMCINNLGMFHWNRSEFDEALSYFFEALKMNDSNTDESGRSIYLNNIGLIYQEMNLSEKALKYHNEALAIRENLNLKNEQVSSLNNIGINLKDLGRLDEAIQTFKKGIEIAEQTNNLLDYYKILDNLANAYYAKGNYQQAIAYYLKALEKPEEFFADEKSELGVYTNLTSLYNEINEPKKALTYSQKAFDLIKKYPQIEGISADLNLFTAESYYMLGNFSKARTYTSKFITLKDSLFSDKNAQAIADLEVKYDTEKKEKQILIHRADLAEKELLLQQRNYQIYGLLGLAVILVCIGYLFFNQQKLKNKQLQKENELKDALVKIETQNKLQEQRLTISRDLHDNIGAQLTFIISSIDNLKYGFNISNQGLEDKLSSISDFTRDTIYELRDTIWAMNKSEITFEDLQSRISNFIEKADITSKDIKFDFSIDKNVDTKITFSSVTGMNIYRIIQEAVNNAIKYAKAENIAVKIKSNNGSLVIKIVDDGIGFDIKNIELGNGINNMKKRTEEIHGAFSIDSTINEGTTVFITL